MTDSRHQDATASNSASSAPTVVKRAKRLSQLEAGVLLSAPSEVEGASPHLRPSSNWDPRPSSNWDAIQQTHSHRSDEDTHGQKVTSDVFIWRQFLVELAIMLTSPFSIPIIYHIYGPQVIVNKRIFPRKGTPTIFVIIAIIETWMPWVVNLLVYGYGMRDLYAETALMDFLLVTRFVVTALRYGYMAPEMRNIIYYSTDNPLIERAHNHTQLATAWLSLSPDLIMIHMRDAAHQACIDYDRPIDVSKSKTTPTIASTSASASAGDSVANPVPAQAHRDQRNAGEVVEDATATITVGELACAVVDRTMQTDDTYFGYRHFMNRPDIVAAEGQSHAKFSAAATQPGSLMEELARKAERSARAGGSAVARRVRCSLWVPWFCSVGKCTSSRILTLCWIFSFIISAVIPLVCRYVAFGDLDVWWRDGARWREGGWDNVPSPDAMISNVSHTSQSIDAQPLQVSPVMFWCTCAVLVVTLLWESFIVVMLLSIGYIDAFRVSRTMSLMYSVIRAPAHTCSKGVQARQKSAIAKVSLGDAIPVVDPSVGDNASAWLDARRLLLAFGSTFRVRSNAAVGMTIAVNVLFLGQLVMFLLQKDPLSDATGSSGPLFLQRKWFVQYVVALLSFAVISAATALVMFGDRVNHSAAYHAHALLTSQLALRQRMADLRDNAHKEEQTPYIRPRSRTVAGALSPKHEQLARLERTDTIIESTVITMQARQAVAPFSIYGIPLNDELLSSFALGFLSTAAVIIRVITYEPDQVS